MTEKGVYSLLFTFYYVYLSFEMQRIELKVESNPKEGRVLQKQSNEHLNLKCQLCTLGLQTHL